ncbi:hypothetical protein H4Q26_010474 [Puccinia striiformis f. sp. tritici PST-130]|nr:hypothetical protein H4Q26_010474 [Puccinia striiformis f. sp. tritici PST-130]
MDKMADATIKPANELEHQRLDEQGDLVIQGFNYLIRIYSRPIALTCSRASLAETMLSLPKDEDGLKDMAIHHRVTFCDRWPLVQPLQDFTMEQIGSSITLVYPQSTSARERTDDQHLQRLKSFRLHSLRTAFLAACPGICQSLQSATELVEQAKLALPTGEFELGRPHEITDDIEVSVLLIDSIIKVTERSDWDLAMNHWECELGDINVVLERILPSQPGTDDKSETPQCAIAAGLAQLAIPLLKLSRLFFDKLTLRGINTKRLPFFTDMCSAQIESFVKALKQVTYILDSISRHLACGPPEPGWDPEPECYGASIRQAEGLKTTHQRFSDPELLQELVQDLEHSAYRSYWKFYQFCQICARQLGIASLIPA